MNIAFQKTLELLIIIAIGVFLQKKVAKTDLKGVKILILSVALPAVIFVALLKIKLESSLLIFPVLALAFNLLMLLASKYYLSKVLPTEHNARKRTIMMLLPSLAPGLSCFPFIVVYLGDDYLALSALADVGNKIFVLILLYMLAMQWYNMRSIKKVKKSMNKKIKGLLISMINEPINLVIIIALVLLGFGITLSSLPNFLENTITKLSAIMAPLVLLFIGMAVRINANEFGLILSLLARRAGITFLMSALFIFIFPALGASMILFLIVFPQSSCSFWPFAHMSAIATLEEKDEQTKPTFDIDFAVNVLACSLPFSTLLIIGVFSFSNVFINPIVITISGLLMLGLSYTPNAIKIFKKAKTHSDEHIDAISLNLETQVNDND